MDMKIVLEQHDILLSVSKFRFSAHPGSQFRDLTLPDAFSDILAGPHGNLQFPVANGVVFHPDGSGGIGPADPQGYRSAEGFPG